ncbi:MAG: type I-B CRISPR-associated protein Cas8b1/Cst1 [Anaerolineae bacterium]|nr:type I-B CRISPR-associated protein Cas8b1/Cst1 [Anaerolineae bacterium]
MLKYTGHPFIDVGVATIVAFASERAQRDLQVEEVTEDDLAAIADFLEPLWLQENMKIKIFLFSNSTIPVPTNPSKSAPKYLPDRINYAQRMLRAYRPEVAALEGTRCAFCGDVAVDIASRGQVPLLNGLTIINFSPRGQGGVPICGYCLLAVHAMPLGCIKNQGKLLCVHADHQLVTSYFARQALHKNRMIIGMLNIGEAEEWPNQGHPKTRLVDALTNALANIKSTSERQYSHSRNTDWMGALTAYHFSNLGSGPGIAIYELPSSVVDFVRETEGQKVHTAWEYYVRRAWIVPKPKRGEGEAEAMGDHSVWKNMLYENLFDLPRDWQRFIVGYLMPSGRDFDTWENLPDGNWELIQLFFRKVIDMEQKRINAIRTLGDRLAIYIQHRDRRLFNEIHFARDYGALRFSLVKVARDGWSPDTDPIYTMDMFNMVFEEEDETASLSWRLARDVLMIRICEELHQAGWFAANRDLIPRAEDEQED